MTRKSTAVSSTLSKVGPEIISSNLRINYLKIKFYDEQGTMIHIRNLHFTLFLSVKTEPKSPHRHKGFYYHQFYYFICSFYFLVKTR